jgi:ketosteroid isomerase-like protein
MRKILVILLATANCYGLISCNSKNSEKASDSKLENSMLDKKWAKSFLDSINTKFSQQIATGDSVGLASHYWPDAELLLDNSEVIEGKNILNAWGDAIRMGVKEMIFTTTDITGSPTFIIETGNYEMKDAAKSLLDRGKYVVVWENRNGEWKLYRDIGSTSMPPTK